MQKMKGLLLLSGGIDSPVAGYLMKKKLSIEAIYFDNAPFAEETAKKRTIDNARKIGLKKLYIVPMGLAHEEYMKHCEKKYECVFCKRMMLWLSEVLAKKIKADVLVNGDNLAQVASQTLPNLYAVSSAVRIPIVRPLIGFDKNEIINVAKRIGTYDISIRPAFCCSAVPKQPSTRAGIEKIENEEAKIDINRIVNKCLEKVEVIKL